MSEKKTKETPGEKYFSKKQKKKFKTNFFRNIRNTFLRNPRKKYWRNHVNNSLKKSRKQN